MAEPKQNSHGNKSSMSATRDTVETPANTGVEPIGIREGTVTPAGKAGAMLTM